MNNVILLKLGEIVLKGLNRKSFESRLLSIIRNRLSHIGVFKVYCIQSTIYVEAGDSNSDIDRAYEVLKKVFGIIKMNKAAVCEKNLDAIVKLASTYLENDFHRSKTFKVESKRSDKSFKYTSIEISQYVGGELSEIFPDVSPDMHEPDLIVHVEVRDLAAYVYGDSIPGAGGMPIGSNGTAVSLLSGGIDSPVSSYLIARRGVSLIPVHFFSFPYTSELAKDKVLKLASILSEYCGKMSMLIVPFTHIQEEIRDKCPEEYFTLIMRRFMMRIAEAVAHKYNAKAIVTGENLGQVASQTMEAMATTQAVIDMPLLQPLIGLDKEDIVQIARKIGTFETSILPYEDCCTVFTPKHPKTRPAISEVEKAEQSLDVELLIKEALDNIEKVTISYEQRV